jgi:hypothetical protein
MNFKARGRMKASPEFVARVKMDPVRFETSLAGECGCHVSALTGHVGEIRVRLAIPFLKRRRRLPLVATIGDFHIRLQPFDVNLGLKHVHAAGTLGTEGLAGEIDAKMKCEMEGEVDGNLPIKLRPIHLDLDESGE